MSGSRNHQSNAVGIAIAEPALAGAVMDSLAAADQAGFVFERADVLWGTWPERSFRAIVATPDALQRNVRAASGEADCPLILAVRRSAMAAHRHDIARTNSFVITDENLMSLPSLVPLSHFGLSIMPKLETHALTLNCHFTRLRRLTARDREVLWALGRGARNDAIAAQLGMTTASAKVRIRRIVRQLGFRNRTDTAVFAATLVAGA